MFVSALTGRLPGTATWSGDIAGTRVTGPGQWERLRGGVIGSVRQDGVAAFDGDRTVGRQLRELERRHRRWTVEAACAAAAYPRHAEVLMETRSADRIVVMRAGEIVAEGTPDETSTNPDRYVR